MTLVGVASRHRPASGDGPVERHPRHRIAVDVVHLGHERRRRPAGRTAHSGCCPDTAITAAGAPGVPLARKVTGEPREPRRRRRSPTLLLTPGHVADGPGGRGLTLGVGGDRRGRRHRSLLPRSRAKVTATPATGSPPASVTRHPDRGGQRGADRAALHAAGCDADGRRRLRMGRCRRRTPEQPSTSTAAIARPTPKCTRMMRSLAIRSLNVSAGPRG